MKMPESPSKWVENTVGKGEIARYKQFLIFHSVFERLILQTRKNPGLFGKKLKKKNPVIHALIQNILILRC